MPTAVIVPTVEMCRDDLAIEVERLREQVRKLREQLAATENSLVLCNDYGMKAW